MTTFRLRTRRDQQVPPRPTVLLDWFGGGGSTIQARQSLTSGLTPPAVVSDFLRFAAAVYCADRLAVRPGTWTRSIELGFPVHDPDAWRSAGAPLFDALTFLTGDKWKLAVGSTTEAGYEGRPQQQPIDAVCLFSGGLDSFTGAVDLLADGKRVCLVAHYEGGQAPEIQRLLAQRLVRRYGRDRIGFRRIFLRPAPPAAGQKRPLPDAREPSMRSRSLLFVAAGLLVAAGYGPNVPLYIPENGFIGINVPLTASRSGSLSTRTTHPYFIDKLSEFVDQLGITNPIVNPFRIMTKGEILSACRDQEAIRALARGTLSCAHPEASRYASREQGNCGYCFPCLIRRASLHRVGLDVAADYAFDALREDAELAGERGSDLRALVRSLNRVARPLDVLRNGPVAPEDVAAFAGVYERGRREILVWMNAGHPSNLVRRQLPRS
jgi:7-cyano-7-deazaguanine synthase in queuosine biosynthesis